jgi:hypothetical protein
MRGVIYGRAAIIPIHLLAFCGNKYILRVSYRVQQGRLTLLLVKELYTFNTGSATLGSGRTHSG